ncbi:MAG: twin-arginine translocase subunit TatC [Actinomycetota bacterium]|nr:twin-arginine translocase subunit TatC [Actinomycetota bacterium]
MAWRTKERAKSKARVDAANMTVVQHLTELRDRIFYSMLAVAVGAVICFVLFHWIIGFMVEPYKDITGQKGLIFTQPLEAFLTRMKVSAYGGLVLASPVVFWHLWRFITPGLYPKEKRYAIPFVVSSVVLFAGGAILSLLTFPRALEFLLGVGGENLQPLLSAGGYLSLVFLMAVSFGFAFEFPILVVFLLLARILTTAQLRHWRRIAFLAIVIIAAVVTPSQDPITLFALAVPMYVLYEGAILVGRFTKR